VEGQVEVVVGGPLLCTHRRTLIMKLRLWVQSKGVQQEPLRIGPLRGDLRLALDLAISGKRCYAMS
jgi:hypothetical protein